MRRKDRGEGEAAILDGLALVFEMTVSEEAVEVAFGSSAPADPAERVAAALDAISLEWVDHLDWPQVAPTGVRLGKPTLRLVGAVSGADQNGAAETSDVSAVSENGLGRTGIPRGHSMKVNATDRSASDDAGAAFRDAVAAGHDQEAEAAIHRLRDADDSSTEAQMLVEALHATLAAAAADRAQAHADRERAAADRAAANRERHGAAS